jgi:GT2 family glycosyltransferase
MDDLAVILVSHHGARWLEPCLTSLLAHRGDCAVDVVVVNNAEDGSAKIVADEFPSVRLIRCDNRGFAHANNQGLLTCNARYVLFLNVDTEILEGTLEELVAALDARPTVGLAGVRQLDAGGAVAPTMRRFPSAARALGDALGSERMPVHPSWSGERILDRSLYESEQACDWTSGSFLVARMGVIDDVGPMDDRFFLYSEEPDLCLRAKQRGWDVRHLPVMTIRHHGGNARVSPALAAQDAYSRVQYARKHFSSAHRAAYCAALGLGYALRASVPGRSRSHRRQSSRAALRTLLGVGDPPFGQQRHRRSLLPDSVPLR